MDFSSPETWRWIWLVAVVAFTVGEMAIAGSFFLAPFAVGSAVAALAAFAGVDVGIEWALFLLGSVATFAGLRPLARRLDQRTPHAAIGATRWTNRQAVVTRDIPANGIGMVRLDSEEWRAESLTGDPIRAGSTVLVSRVDGTRMVVMAIEEPPALPSEGDI